MMCSINFWIFSKHKQTRNKHKYRKVVVPGIHHTVMGDLIEYTNSKFVRNNDGYRYILVVIDCFSRFAHTRPIKQKTAEEVSKQLDDIFGSMSHTPSYFGSDKGREFSHDNDYVKRRVRSKYGIKMYYMTGKRKGSIVERWNRTFKSTLERYFTSIKGSDQIRKRGRWIDVLPQITNNINNRVNRSIQMKPAEVTVADNNRLRELLYGSQTPMKNCRFNIGDKVRIPQDRNVFDKGYTQSMLLFVRLNL